MPRALLIVLDSVGAGGARDAAAFGDGGADTLGHIAEACATGRGDQAGLRSGPLALPRLAALGLAHAAELSSGRPLAGVERPAAPRGQWGCAAEVSKGKDTPSGHWEIAGRAAPFAWGYFPDTWPSFPPELTEAVIRAGGLPGILGNRHAPGTAIIEELGTEHMRTGKPICYTSVDSVFQIAAHEETFGLERLYDLCRAVRLLVDPLKIGRVIARPFVGTPQTGFTRTGNRKDFAMPPPDGTILDRAMAAGRRVVSVGKIGDIFAHRSTGEEIKPHGNDAVLTATIEAFRTLPDGGLVFSNLVDFDTLYGHRRDVAGYAAALEAFDARLPEIEAALRPGDVAIVTADHGNDPTWRGSDHTREQIPVVAFGPGLAPGCIGRRETFADIGETVAAHLGLPVLGPGKPWTA
ncbi:phosphopentomutase [Chelatococcus sp. SYSU_G07232]|uniref:Phosphopentomutase n=1 Tax=Chelatococcus albus TaxID=3047466 RepID=A0ABT7AG87_9HYPH|nr:phosphopentomutase [Chelatococcus sp. SYSU_G07232]MDJ1157661.1 phosphopentomutase [Chelatococcus sp. SYSU_G07232]